MRTLRIALLLCLAFVVAEIQGQDFDLSDAFDEPPPTPKPVPPTVKPNADPVPRPNPASTGDEFNLDDAVGGPDPVVTKRPPQPNPGVNTGGEFGDDDLAAGLPPRPNNPSGDQEDSGDGKAEAQQPGAIAGIVSAAGVALLGAVTSFVAYQKKKLCFKGEGDPENVNMDQQSGDKSEPQVQHTLLER